VRSAYFLKGRWEKRRKLDLHPQSRDKERDSLVGKEVGGIEDVKATKKAVKRRIVGLPTLRRRSLFGRAMEEGNTSE